MAEKMPKFIQLHWWRSIEDMYLRYSSPYPSIQESKCLVMLRFFRWKHLPAWRHQPIVPLEWCFRANSKTSPILANASPSYHRQEWHRYTFTDISPKKNWPKKTSKKEEFPPNFPKLPTKFSFQNPGNNPFLPPVVTSTCPALMTWSRSNSAHGTVTGTAKPYLGINVAKDVQKSPFICDPSWLGKLWRGGENCQTDDHLHENWVVGWFLEFLMGCVISYRFVTFTCPVFADYFELVDSSIFRIVS